VVHGADRIVLSQRKYVLDLLRETDMLGCKPVVSPIDVNVKMSAYVREHIDHKRYQRLIGKLIYLSHARLDILFTLSAVSRYMHYPRNDHMDANFYILRYLKSAPRKDLIFRKNEHMNIMDYYYSDWTSC
jgi:hypothetical protein